MIVMVVQWWAHVPHNASQIMTSYTAAARGGGADKTQFKNKEYGCKRQDK